MKFIKQYKSDLSKDELTDKLVNAIIDGDLSTYRSIQILVEEVLFKAQVKQPSKSKQKSLN